MITITLLSTILCVLIIYLIVKVIVITISSIFKACDNKSNISKSSDLKIKMEDYINIAKESINTYVDTHIDDFELMDIAIEKQSLYMPVDTKIDYILDEQNRNIIGTENYKEKDWKKFYWDISVIYKTRQSVRTGKSKIGFLSHEKSGIYFAAVVHSDLLNK